MMDSYIGMFNCWNVTENSLMKNNLSDIDVQLFPKTQTVSSRQVLTSTKKLQLR